MKTLNLFRHIVTGLIGTALVGTLAIAQTPETVATEAATPNGPNIVFIFADDLGYGDIGAYGADDIQTPNIDSIAQQGILFTDFYSISPVCTPSRAGLLTGRYPIRMGIHHVFFPGSYQGMPEDEITIAEVLQSAGYRTAISGKWHLGHRDEFLPLNQGFDEYFGIPYSNDMSPLPLMIGNDFVEDNVDQTMLTQRITDFAVDFINRSADAPFFLYVPHPMPHVPLYTSPEFEGVSERGPYGDVIEELDHSVGQIMEALKANGIAENTLLVFTSDNGPWLYMGKDSGSSGELRNGKGTTFEGGMKVPTVAMMPSTIDPGSIHGTPVSMIDWMPTISELTGTSLPNDRVIDGISLVPALTGETNDLSPARPLAYYSGGKLEAIRIGDWKLKRPYSTKGSPIPGFLRPFFKGEVGLAPHETLLFNLSEDPGETNNLASKNPEKLAELEAAAANFEAEMGDTPPSITILNTGISAPIAVLLSTVSKVFLSVFGIILLLVAVLAFWLGRRGRTRKAS